MFTAYYNEFDPKAAAWLRQLIKNGNITLGEVDERSITEVEPSDLKGFSQHHFFAGIGGWSYALRLAGWADDRRVWTASPPCQPFSAAGKGLGKTDERHLLPHYLNLVRECKPNVCFGEQVEGAIRHGWLDDLQTNMEAEGYAVGHCVLGAHSIGAAHIRQRLYWVANNSRSGYQKQSSIAGISSEKNGNDERKNSAGSGWMGDTEHNRYISSEKQRSNGTTIQCSKEGQDSTGHTGASASELISWIYCRDNRHRPIKPGIKPLVDGAAERMVQGGDSSEQIYANNTQEARVMRLKGYGNAIHAQTAMAFIKAYMSI